MYVYMVCTCNGGIGACGIENKQVRFSPIECIYIYINRCNDDSYECTLRVYIYEIVIHF